jgi:3-methylcrotonyl-CoA carboxylase alpha subunit
MYRRIEFLDRSYDVTVTGRLPDYCIQIEDAESRSAGLAVTDSGDHVIRLGDRHTRVRIKVKGEMVHLRAFGRTFDLRIVNPVEQAGLVVRGGSDQARAPMPGVVVDLYVAEGERIARGQPMLTIESMKILTTVMAPGHGKVGKIHFLPGQSFEKGASLITLHAEEE